MATYDPKDLFIGDSAEMPKIGVPVPKQLEVGLSNTAYPSSGNTVDPRSLFLSAPADSETDAAFKAAARALPSGVAGLAGAAAGTQGGATLGAFFGPGAPVAVPTLGFLGGIAGAFGASSLTGKAVDWAVPRSEQERINPIANPKSVTAGSFAGSMAPFKLNVGGIAGMLSGEAAAYKEAAKNAAAMYGFGSGTRFLEATSLTPEEGGVSGFGNIMEASFFPKEDRTAGLHDLAMGALVKSNPLGHAAETAGSAVIRAPIRWATTPRAPAAAPAAAPGQAPRPAVVPTAQADLLAEARSAQDAAVVDPNAPIPLGPDGIPVATPGQIAAQQVTPAAAAQPAAAQPAAPVARPSVQPGTRPAVSVGADGRGQVEYVPAHIPTHEGLAMPQLLAAHQAMDPAQAANSIVALNAEAHRRMGVLKPEDPVFIERIVTMTGDALRDLSKKDQQLAVTTGEGLSRMLERQIAAAVSGQSTYTDNHLYEMQYRKARIDDIVEHLKKGGNVPINYTAEGATKYVSGEKFHAEREEAVRKTRATPATPEQLSAEGELDIQEVPIRYSNNRWKVDPKHPNGGFVDKEAGTAPAVDHDGRIMVLRSINGVQVPFYLSTGEGGKKDVPDGKWYPFFGVSNGSWINKIGGLEMANRYGRKELQVVAEQLDRTIGDVRHKARRGVIPEVGGGSGFEHINEGFNIPERDSSNLVGEVRANINNLFGRLDQAKALRDAKLAAEPKTNKATITNINEMIAQGGGTVEVSVDGKKVEFDKFALTIDGNEASVMYVELKDKQKTGQGIGKAAYIALGNQLAEQGITLTSSGSLLPPGSKLWLSLIRDGYAVRKGNHYDFVAKDSVAKPAAPAAEAPAPAVEAAKPAQRPKEYVNPELQAEGAAERNNQKPEAEQKPSSLEDLKADYEQKLAKFEEAREKLKKMIPGIIVFKDGWERQAKKHSKEAAALIDEIKAKAKAKNIANMDMSEHPDYIAESRRKGQEILRQLQEKEDAAKKKKEQQAEKKPKAKPTEYLAPELQAEKPDFPSRFKQMIEDNLAHQKKNPKNYPEPSAEMAARNIAAGAHNSADIIPSFSKDPQAHHEAMLALKKAAGLPEDYQFTSYGRYNSTKDFKARNDVRHWKPSEAIGAENPADVRERERLFREDANRSNNEEAGDSDAVGRSATRDGIEISNVKNPYVLRPVKGAVKEGSLTEKPTKIKFDTKDKDNRPEYGDIITWHNFGEPQMSDMINGIKATLPDGTEVPFTGQTGGNPGRYDQVAFGIIQIKRGKWQIEWGQAPKNSYAVERIAAGEIGMEGSIVFDPNNNRYYRIRADIDGSKQEQIAKVRHFMESDVLTPDQIKKIDQEQRKVVNHSEADKAVLRKIEEHAKEIESMEEDGDLEAVSIEKDAAKQTASGLSTKEAIKEAESILGFKLKKTPAKDGAKPKPKKNDTSRPRSENPELDAMYERQREEDQKFSDEMEPQRKAIEEVEEKAVEAFNRGDRKEGERLEDLAESMEAEIREKGRALNKKHFKERDELTGEKEEEFTPEYDNEGTIINIPKDSMGALPDEVHNDKKGYEKLQKIHDYLTRLSLKHDKQAGRHNRGQTFQEFVEESVNHRDPMNGLTNEGHRVGDIVVEGDHLYIISHATDNELHLEAIWPFDSIGAGGWGTDSADVRATGKNILREPNIDPAKLAKQEKLSPGTPYHQDYLMGQIKKFELDKVDAALKKAKGESKKMLEEHRELILEKMAKLKKEADEILNREHIGIADDSEIAETDSKLLLKRRNGLLSEINRITNEIEEGHSSGSFKEDGNEHEASQLYRALRRRESELSDTEEIIKAAQDSGSWKGGDLVSHEDYKKAWSSEVVPEDIAKQVSSLNAAKSKLKDSLDKLQYKGMRPKDIVAKIESINSQIDKLQTNPKTGRKYRNSSGEGTFNEYSEAWAEGLSGSKPSGESQAVKPKQIGGGVQKGELFDSSEDFSLAGEKAAPPPTEKTEDTTGDFSTGAEPAHIVAARDQLSKLEKAGRNPDQQEALRKTIKEYDAQAAKPDVSKMDGEQLFAELDRMDDKKFSGGMAEMNRVIDRIEQIYPGSKERIMSRAKEQQNDDVASAIDMYVRSELNSRMRGDRNKAQAKPNVAVAKLLMELDKATPVEGDNWSGNMHKFENPKNRDVAIAKIKEIQQAGGTLEDILSKFGLKDDASPDAKFIKHNFNQAIFRERVENNEVAQGILDHDSVLKGRGKTNMLRPTAEIAEEMNIGIKNVSRLMQQLVREKLVEPFKGSKVNTANGSYTTTYKLADKVDYKTLQARLREIAGTKAEKDAPNTEPLEIKGKKGLAMAVNRQKTLVEEAPNEATKALREKDLKRMQDMIDATKGKDTDNTRIETVRRKIKELIDENVFKGRNGGLDFIDSSRARDLMDRLKSYESKVGTVEQQAEAVLKPSGENEPADISQARKDLSAIIRNMSRGEGWNAKRAAAEAKIEQYEIEQKLLTGNHLPTAEDLQVISNKALEEFVERFGTGEVDPEITRAVEGELSARFDAQERAGVQENSVSDTASRGDLIADIKNLIAKHGNKLGIPSLPKEFEAEGLNTLREQLSQGQVMALMRNPEGMGKVDKERAKTDRTYRLEMKTQAEGQLSRLASALNELGWTQFDPTSQNSDTLVQAIVAAGRGEILTPKGGVLGAKAEVSKKETGVIERLYEVDKANPEDPFSRRDLSPEAAKRELDRRQAQNAKNREGDPEARKGYSGIVSRVTDEMRLRGDLTPKEVEGVTRIMNKIGSQFFEGVKMKVGEGERAGEYGQYETVNRIISIFKDAIRNGKFEETAAHEIAHHIARFLPEADRQAVIREMQAKRGEFLKKNKGLENLFSASDRNDWAKRRFNAQEIANANLENPTAQLVKLTAKELQKEGYKPNESVYRLKLTDETYRLTKPDEYFAEEFKDNVMRELNSDPVYLGRSRNWKEKLAGLWQDIKLNFQKMFGKQVANKILSNFAKGRYSPEQEGDASIAGMGADRKWESGTTFNKREPGQRELDMQVSGEVRLQDAMGVKNKNKLTEAEFERLVKEDPSFNQREWGYEMEEGHFDGKGPDARLIGKRVYKRVKLPGMVDSAAETKAQESLPKNDVSNSGSGDVLKSVRDASREQSDDPEVFRNPRPGQSVTRTAWDIASGRFFSGISGKAHQNAERHSYSESVKEVANMIHSRPGTKSNSFERDLPTAVMLARNKYHNRLNKAMEPLRDMLDGFKSTDQGTAKQQREEVYQALNDMITGRKDITSGAIGETARGLRDLLGEMHQYRTEAGEQIGHVEAFYPAVYDSVRIGENRKDFIRDARTAYEMEIAASGEAGQAKALGLSKAEFADMSENNGQKLKEDLAELAEQKALALYNAHVRGASATEFDSIFGMADKSGAENSALQRKFGRDAQNIMRKWQVNDPFRVVGRYITTSAKRAELVRKFGNKGEGWKRLSNQMEKDGVPYEIISEMRELARGAAGIGMAQRTKSEQTYVDTITLMTAASAMGRGFLNNLVEPVTIGMRTGSPVDILRAYVETWSRFTREVAALSPALKKKMGNTFWSEYGHEIGTIHNSIEDAWMSTHSMEIDSEYSDPRFRWLTNRIYKANLMDASETAKQQASHALGFSYINKLGAMFRGEHWTSKLGLKADQSVRDQLSELGVKPELHESFTEWTKKLGEASDSVAMGMMTERSEMAELHREAMARFSMQSSVRSNRAHKPVFQDGLLGKTVLQLMNFSYSYAAEVNTRMYNMSKQAFWASPEGKNYGLYDRLRLMGPAAGGILSIAAYRGLLELKDLLYPSESSAKRAKDPEIVKWMNATSYAGLLGPKVEQAMKSIKRDQAVGGPVGQMTVNVARAGGAVLGDVANGGDINSAKKSMAKAAVPLLKGGIVAGASAVNPALGTVATQATNAPAFTNAIVPQDGKKSGGLTPDVFRLK